MYDLYSELDLRRGSSFVSDCGGFRRRHGVGTRVGGHALARSQAPISRWHMEAGRLTPSTFTAGIADEASNIDLQTIIELSTFFVVFFRIVRNSYRNHVRMYMCSICDTKVITLSNWPFRCARKRSSFISFQFSCSLIFCFLKRVYRLFFFLPASSAAFVFEYHFPDCFNSLTNNDVLLIAQSGRGTDKRRYDESMRSASPRQIYKFRRVPVLFAKVVVGKDVLFTASPFFTCVFLLSFCRVVVTVFNHIPTGIQSNSQSSRLIG